MPALEMRVVKQLLVTIKSLIDGRVEYFEDLLNIEVSDDGPTNVQTDQENVLHANNPITMEELEKDIKLTKVNKAPGQMRYC